MQSETTELSNGKLSKNMIKKYMEDGFLFPINIFNYKDSSRFGDFSPDILSSYDPGRRFFIQLEFKFNNKYNMKSIDNLFKLMNKNLYIKKKIENFANKGFII